MAYFLLALASCATVLLGVAAFRAAFKAIHEDELEPIRPYPREQALRDAGEAYHKRIAK